VKIPGGTQCNDSVDEIALKGDRPDDFVFETLEDRPEKAALADPIAEPSTMDANLNHFPVTVTSEDEPCLTQSSIETVSKLNIIPSCLVISGCPIRGIGHAFINDRTRSDGTCASEYISGGIFFMSPVFLLGGKGGVLMETIVS